MISTGAFKKIALSFPDVSEAPHFEKTSFRVSKKIFATLDAKNSQACIKLSAIQQNVFCAFDKTVIFPVPNKWGQQGWTNINLKKVPKDTLTDALKVAYELVVSKKTISKKK